MNNQKKEVSMLFKTFNNGYKIPTLGTGTNTYGKVDKDFFGDINFDTKELLSAMNLGYRLIDTAIYYRNEAVIGKAIKESKLKRDDLFITTKIPEKPEYSETNERVISHIEASLKNIDAEYIDLYLMHFPLETNVENLRVWKVLESYVIAGKIKSIGVSNFNIEQLQYLIDHASIKPVLNQFQSYPGRHQQDLIDFCKENEIIPEAYHSIAKVSEENKKTLTDIGKKHDKLWSQVILNYQIHEGLVVIPKSHNPVNQKNNIDVFDFHLTEEDKTIIRNM